MRPGILDRDRPMPYRNVHAALWGRELGVRAPPIPRRALAPAPLPTWYYVPEYVVRNGSRIYARRYYTAAQRSALVDWYWTTKRNLEREGARVEFRLPKQTYLAPDGTRKLVDWPGRRPYFRVVEGPGPRHMIYPSLQLSFPDRRDTVLPVHRRVLAQSPRRRSFLGSGPQDFMPHNNQRAAGGVRRRYQIWNARYQHDAFVGDESSSESEN